jgi:hypothetical protein
MGGNPCQNEGFKHPSRSARCVSMCYIRKKGNGPEGRKCLEMPNPREVRDGDQGSGIRADG